MAYYGKTIQQRGCITMCKVYNFPTKLELSEELKVRIGECAKNYVKNINEILDDIHDKYGELDGYDELMAELPQYYLEAIIECCDELEV